MKVYTAYFIRKNMATLQKSNKTALAAKFFSPSLTFLSCGARSNVSEKHSSTFKFLDADISLDSCQRERESADQVIKCLPCTDDFA